MQYVHRSGCAFVRVASKGFVWINNRLKVNDPNSSSEARLETSKRLLLTFVELCDILRFAHSLVEETVERALDSCVCDVML
jgi:hypothetical protein